MGFLNTDSMPRLVEKLADGDNIKITGNSKGNRVGTVIKKIVEKADDVTKAVEQEIVNDSYSFKVGTGDVDVSADVQDGFGEVGIKGVTYQNLIPNLIDSRWKVRGSAIKDRTDLVNGVKLVITSEGSCVFDLIDISMFKPNTKYTLLVNIDTNFTEIRLSNILSSFVKLENGFNCVTFLTKSDFNEMHTCFRIGYTGSLSTGLYMTIKDLIVLEGDHTNNPNLPSYFEGIIGVGDKSKNLFNNNTITEKYYINSGGGLTSSAESYYSDYIEVEKNTDYLMGKVIIKRIALYDDNKNFIKRFDSASGNFLVVNTESAKYVRISGSIDELYKTQFEKGTTPTDYIEYYDGYKIEILSNGKNLFSVNKNKFTENRAFNTSTGNYYTTQSGDWYATLDYIPLLGFKIGDYLVSSSSRCVICFYDSNKNYLGFSNSNVTIKSIPQNSKYYRVETHKDYLNNFQIEIINTQTPTPYECYKEDKTQILLDEPLMRLPNGICDEITRDGTEIRRVGKIVLDGSFDFYASNTGVENKCRWMMYKNSNVKNVNGDVMSTICSHFSSVSVLDTWHCTKEGIAQNNGSNCIYLFLEKYSSMSDSSLNKSLLRTELQANPVTLYYELAEPIITNLSKSAIRIFKDGHLTFNTLVAPESTHVVQLNKSAQIERSIREVQSLDSRVGQLESFYDDMMLETSYKLNLLNYDFEYTRERNGE